MQSKTFAFAALTFASTVCAAQQAPIIPIGVSGNANYSTAWFFDTSKNHVVVCRSSDRAPVKRECTVMPLPK